jgi:hypothetical protein
MPGPEDKRNEGTPIPSPFVFDEIPRDQLPQDLGGRILFSGTKTYVCPHPDGGKTYVTQDDNYVAFIDFDTEGNRVGEGSIEPSNEREPGRRGMFVKWTESLKQKEGLETRRLLLMNAFSKGKFGLPLYSGAYPSDEARRIWQILVKEGKARSFTRLEQEQYVFLE